MLRIGSILWRGKCPKHPGFDPRVESAETIRGACEKCLSLAEIHAHHTRMIALMRRFSPPKEGKNANKQTAADGGRQGSLFGD